MLSDGDVVFQPRKVERSGLWEAVADNVLIYVHKERELENVERRFPARRYVMVDDKVRILTAIKAVWGDASRPCSSARDTTPSTCGLSRPIQPTTSSSIASTDCSTTPFSPASRTGPEPPTLPRSRE